MTSRCYLLAASLLAALPLAARAQANFQPGYVVRPAGDTLRGEIDLRDPYFNATECRFRPTATAEARLYRPAELAAYGLPAAGRRWRTLLVAPGAAPVFAEVLAAGPATLYDVRDPERNGHYYLEAPQFPLTELQSRRMLLPGRTLDQDVPVYRTTLAQALPNCPRAEALARTALLSAQSLARVVTAFNECRGVAAPVSHAAGAHPRLGVLLGAQLVSMKLTYPSSVSQGTVSADVPTVGGPVVGATLSLPLGGLSRKLSLEAALFYARQRYALTVNSGNGIVAQRQDVDITLGWLRLPVLLRYTPLPQAKVGPVLELGPTIDYAVTLDATITTTDSFNRINTKPFYEGNQRRLQEGLCAGLGLQTHYRPGRLATLLARYEADNGWTDGNNLENSANRYYLVLALDLTK